jgi:DNA repair protein RadA/Sms
MAMWGEVGLTGEVRSVGRAEVRLREAVREGYPRCIVPASNVKGLPRVEGAHPVGVRTLAELLDVLALT